MKKILVTGGLGYIGSHTTVELQKEGYEVVIADNLSNSRLEVLDGIEAITGQRPNFEKLDISLRGDVHQLLEKHPEIQGVIHFAAFKAVGESVEKPLSYYRNNLDSLIYLLEEMIARELDHFIFSSSCTVYGEADEMPITEQAPIKPAESPYGNTKQIGEEILKDASKNGKIQVIALRYFNPVGAHPSSEIGELPLGVPQNLVPFVTQTVAGVRPELKVFGNDYPTRDGTAIRDYIHVVDLARAHVAALNRLINERNESPMEIFNLGTGKGSTVLEVIQAFEKVTGKSVPYSFAPRRDGDVTEAWADTSLASSVLGWHSELTLEDAMRDAWNWERKVREIE
ncbi:MAG: UDP-glucose 4-epimerase GalE [Bacteroidota bacterium]|nr:UDP-glucose 4-epimerase GalE [Bacteroidota bacterium]